jgi:hypothetical protein
MNKRGSPISTDGKSSERESDHRRGGEGTTLLLIKKLKARYPKSTAIQSLNRRRTKIE